MGHTCTVEAHVKIGDKVIKPGQPVELSESDIERFRAAGHKVSIGSQIKVAPEFGVDWPLTHDSKASASLAAEGLTTVKAVLDAGEEAVTSLPNVGAGTWAKFADLGEG